MHSSVLLSHSSSERCTKEDDVAQFQLIQEDLDVTNIVINEIGTLWRP
jgi:hypothetical protein